MSAWVVSVPGLTRFLHDLLVCSLQEAMAALIWEPYICNFTDNIYSGAGLKRIIFGSFLCVIDVNLKHEEENW